MERNSNDMFRRVMRRLEENRGPIIMREMMEKFSSRDAVSTDEVLQLSKDLGKTSTVDDFISYIA